MSGPTVSRSHVRRLREVYRGSGWPCLDVVEAELLVAGWLERIARQCPDGSILDCLRVTDAGLQAMVAGTERNRAAYDAHESLVAQVARSLRHGGRIVYTGLSLRAPVVDAVSTTDPATRPKWVMAKPDVFSIRNTSVPAYLAPAVHEIKARRADLLGELRTSPRTLAKRGAYLAMSSECWYVLGLDGKGREIADPGEIPAEFGVLVQARTQGGRDRLVLARSAPKRSMAESGGLPFAAWMALAKAIPHPPEDPVQQRL